MAGNPQQSPTSGSPQQKPSAPKQLAAIVGDWARSMIIIIVWTTALGIALGIALLVLRCALQLFDLSQEAIFP